ncbi:hypothetical protein MBRU_02290 [Mycolicibacterium brumae DSM 44177]|nr:hypothetical protein MBRU_02290 [Mycolicibacterium brumae DSM 44177]
MIGSATTGLRGEAMIRQAIPQTMLRTTAASNPYAVPDIASEI